MFFVRASRPNTFTRVTRTRKVKGGFRKRGGDTGIQQRDSEREIYRVGFLGVENTRKAIAGEFGGEGGN